MAFRDPLPGDVNGDGVTDILDIVVLVGFILDGHVFSDDEFLASDVSDDGSVDILDVVQIVGLILNGPDPISISLDTYIDYLPQGWESLPEWISDVVVDEGPVDNTELFYNSHPSELEFAHFSGQTYLMALDPDFSGIVTYGIAASNSFGAADTVYGSLQIGDDAVDVTFNVRKLFEYGSPLWTGIPTTVVVDGVEYTTNTGTITIPLMPGPHNIWAENDSTGVFNDNIGRFDAYMIVTQFDRDPIEDGPIDQRDAMDYEAIVNVPQFVETAEYEILKPTWTEWDNFVLAAQIYDNSTPHGMDKVNVNEPPVYADTTFEFFEEPTPGTLSNAEYNINTFFPELASAAEIPNFAPQWQGLSEAPPVDEDSDTQNYLLFDSRESPPGHHGENVNLETNEIYAASVYSPSENSLTNLTGEMIQAYAGARNDPPGGSGINGYVLDVDEWGIPHPNEFLVDMTKLWGHAAPGFRFGEDPDMNNENSNVSITAELNKEFEYHIKDSK